MKTYTQMEIPFPTEKPKEIKVPQPEKPKP
jgi:hypothetical protein